MPLKYIALATNKVEALQSGESDANDQIPETSISDGNGNPCRHCLSEIPLGEPMLILAHRPFTTIQPYSEVGPIFLCANQCERHLESAGLPELYGSKDMLIRGYGVDERIIYGTGKVISMRSIEPEANQLFDHYDLAYIHVRSSSNNCYHYRIEM